MSGSTKLRVVVIGGGHAGVTLVQALADAADVKLIEKKGFYEINWATVRASVEPQTGDSSIVAYEDIPKVKDCFIQAKATAVNDSEVTLSTGLKLPYDYLVLAFGSEYTDKFVYCSAAASAVERRTQFQRAHQELERAASVVLVGGGPVGVEMAAEVATGTTGKSVTLVSSADSLLSQEPPKLGAKALRVLTSKGVKVILGSRVEKIPERPGTLRLQGTGEELQADLVYWCVGTQPCSDWLKATHPNIVDAKGLIKVNERLQVEAHPNWFALGDCNNVPEIKFGYMAKAHAEEVTKTLTSIIQNGPDKATWTEHKMYNGLQMIAVTLGKNDGVMHIKGWSMPWFLPTWVKSKNLLVPMTRKAIGLAPAA